MKLKNSPLKSRLDIVGALVLVSGLLLSLYIYLTAEDFTDTVLGNELEDSKKYVRALELYGGKANVFASELSQWFDGLWQGTHLAFTLGIISVVISLGFFFVAYHTEADEGIEDRFSIDRAGRAVKSREE